MASMHATRLARRRSNASNASATAGRPCSESCAKGGKCGGDEDYRVKASEEKLSEAERADEAAHSGEPVRDWTLFENTRRIVPVGRRRPRMHHDRRKSPAVRCFH